MAGIKLVISQLKTFFQPQFHRHSTADKKEKRNLMVFIRPTILRDGMAADGVSQRKYNYMRAEQIYRDEQGLSLMPHTAQPVLPAQNQALPPEVRAFLNAGRTR